MDLPAETLEGARKIVRYWNLLLCDERTACSHDHRPLTAQDRRDLLRDMRRVEEVRRIAEDDFAPSPRPESATGVSLAGGEGDDPEEHGVGFIRVIRLYWRCHAQWLGLADEGPSNGYVGEGADDLGETERI